LCFCSRPRKKKVAVFPLKAKEKNLAVFLLPFLEKNRVGELAKLFHFFNIYLGYKRVVSNFNSAHARQKITITLAYALIIRVSRVIIFVLTILVNN
jgi:hypothetical protein